MSAREKIEQRIAAKEMEIEDYEGRIAGAKIYVQAMAEALSLLPKEPVENGIDPTLRPGTNLDKAREALSVKGRPMHILELLEALGKEDTNTNRAALSGSIAAYVRKGVIFTKPAPNTFGLLGFPRQQSAKEPPPDFGVDSQPPEFKIDNDDVPF